MTAIRRAAAALYGLHQDDRDAILSELSSAEQASLRAALAELESLGFVRSVAAMLDNDEPAAAPGPAPTRADAATDTGDVLVRHLMAQDADRMQRVLAAEPVSLVAELLQMAAWPWAESFLQGLTARRRQQVRDLLLGQSAFPAARRRWLLQTVAQRLDALPPEADAAPARPARPILHPFRWLPWRT